MDEKLVYVIERFNKEKLLAKKQLGESFVDVFIRKTSEYKVLAKTADQAVMKNNDYKVLWQFYSLVHLTKQ